MRSDGTPVFIFTASKNFTPAEIIFDTRGDNFTLSANMFLRKILPIVAILGSALLSPAASTNDPSNPPAVYLTWQRDPTTTMTIHWHTVGPKRSELSFRGAREMKWISASGSHVPLPGTDRFVHTVELTGLSPRKDYEFQFAPGNTFRFRTMPKDLNEHPVRFIAGGDVYHERKWMDAMNALAGKQDPSFVMLGGDLAYSCNKTGPEKIERWFAYFESWKQNARTPDGRLVPMLAAIGNHECIGSWGQTPKNAVGYYTQLSMPGPQGYNALEVGNYLSVYLLDSGITHPVEGAQTEWLKKSLSKRRDVPHKFPIYHIPAYPSFRDDEEGGSGEITQKIRANWCPLFEKYGVKISFENHDHAFKRTQPILEGKVNPKGITYLGDGAWGVNLRTPDPSKLRWYVAKTGSIRHFFLVTLYPDQRHVVTINDKGEIFDETYQRVK